MDEDKIWRDYVAGVTHVKSRKKIKRPPPLPPKRPLEATEIARPASARAVQKPLQNINFTRKIERNLRRGDIVLDGRLDLHGMTQTEAYQVLTSFLAKHVKLGHRTLLVITGKGNTSTKSVSEHHGVLRNKLPLWLEGLPDARHILKLCIAAPKHGGSGAFYLILKRTS